MVAKSFQSMTQIGEPYVSAGKMYVQVKNEKTGTLRQVRWYTESEYAKMYGETVQPEDKPTKTQKQALGFANGYITIFKGNTYIHLDWFKKSIARYCKWWGWYIVSTDEIPTDLPEGIEPVRLDWDKVGNGTVLKPDNLVKEVIDSLVYDESASEFIGMIGDRIEVEVEVISTPKQDGYYGVSTSHYMLDVNGNQYLWSTTAKSWEIGEKHHIKGSVKDHKLIRNVKTTILTRCSVIE